jgi:peptidoglycan hydrolase-like protein with peptidoglycan-binding domain
MLPTGVADLQPPARRRFQEAYDNPKRPIGWWDPDHQSVGVVQAWLLYLDFPLPKSSKVLSSGQVVILDGVFGEETFAAVRQFQARTGVKPDGMVGRNTLDRFAAEIAKRNRRHTPISKSAAVDVVPRGYRCNPGMLICKEPP